MEFIEAWDRAALGWNHREKLLLHLLRMEKPALQNIFKTRHLQELIVIRLLEYYRIHQNDFFAVETADNRLLAFLLKWTHHDAHGLSSILLHHDYFSLFMNEHNRLRDHIYLLKILISISPCLLWTEIAVKFQSLHYNDYCTRILLQFPGHLNSLLLIVVTRIYHNDYGTVLSLIYDLLLFPQRSNKAFGLQLFLYILTNPLSSEHSLRRYLSEGPSDLLELIVCTLVKSDYGLQYKVRNKKMLLLIAP